MNPNEWLYQFKRIPLLRLYLCYVLGILFFQCVHTNHHVFALAIAIICLLSLTAGKLSNNIHLKNIFKGLAISGILIITGGVHVALLQKQDNIIENQKFFSGQVVSDIKKGDGYQGFVMNVDSEGNRAQKVKATLFCDTCPIAPGKQITFYGNIGRINNNGNPGEFDYARYMQRRNIYHQVLLNTSQVKSITDGNAQSLRLKALEFRLDIISAISKYKLSSESEVVLYALALGYKNLLPAQVKEQYAHAGAMHVLAVSGLHVGIIFLILNFLFSLTRINNTIIAQFMVIFAIWGFALITGFSNSVARASFMFTLISFGKMLHRDINIYNILAASAFILTVINPQIISDVGFQLSYSAVAGIVFFQPYFYNFCTVKNKLLDYFWQLFTVSLAAQLATAPFAMYYFHQFPNLFWLTNLFAIPLVFVILLLFVLLLATLPVAFLSNLVAQLLNFSIQLFNGGVKLIDSIPYSHTDGIFINSVQLFIFIIGVVLLGAWLKYKMAILFQLLLVSFILFFVTDVTINQKLKHHKELVIYNAGKNFLLTAKNNNTCLVFSNIDIDSSLSTLNFYTKNYLVQNNCFKKHQILPTGPVSMHKNTIIDFNNNRYLLLYNQLQPKKMPPGDSLIIIPMNIAPFKNLQDYYKVKAVVLASNNNYTNQKLWHLYANTHNLNLFDTRLRGSYVQ